MSEEELRARISELEDDNRRAAGAAQALLASARAVLAPTGFTETARAIFDHCREVTGATSGYVALLSADGAENELLFLEAGGLPCAVDPELPMPIRGLREVAYREQRTVYDNDFHNSEWWKFLPGGHVRIRNVMFAPLILGGTAVGLLGLANKDGDFDGRDAHWASGFGELAALALQRSRDLQQRDAAEAGREQVIGELRNALADVKALSGLLPICSSCKNIRDDNGYWSKLETYLLEHSSIDFSHGICPDCARKLYPDYDIYDE